MSKPIDYNGTKQLPFCVSFDQRLLIIDFLHDFINFKKGIPRRK